MSSFEDISIEDIAYCPVGDYSSGVRCKLYYAPADFFFHTPLPIPSESFESEILINDQILMKSGKQLRHIDILIDESELKTNLTGAAMRKKAKNSLSFYILGFAPSVLGFIKRMANSYMIFFIEDNNGNRWQIGSLRNRAFVESADASSGKKYEDNAGAQISVGCNSQLFLYKNSLEHFSRPGDFNNDFNNDFFKVKYE